MKEKMVKRDDLDNEEKDNKMKMKNKKEDVMRNIVKEKGI